MFQIYETFLHPQNGFISAIPYLANWFVVIGACQLADYLRSKQYLNTTQTRKIFSSIGTTNQI